MHALRQMLARIPGPITPEGLTAESLRRFLTGQSPEDVGQMLSLCRTQKSCAVHMFVVHLAWRVPARVRDGTHAGHQGGASVRWAWIPDTMEHGP